MRSARSDDVVTRVNRGGGDFGENITGNPLLEVAPATSTQLFILVTVHVYFDPRSELSNLIYTAFIWTSKLDIQLKSHLVRKVIVHAQTYV